MNRAPSKTKSIGAPTLSFFIKRSLCYIYLLLGLVCSGIGLGIIDNLYFKLVWAVGYTVFITLVFWAISVFLGKTQAWIQDHTLTLVHNKKRIDVPLAQVTELNVNHYQRQCLRIHMLLDGEEKKFTLIPDMDELALNNLQAQFNQYLSKNKD